MVQVVLDKGELSTDKRHYLLVFFEVSCASKIIYAAKTGLGTLYQPYIATESMYPLDTRKNIKYFFFRFVALLLLIYSCIPILYDFYHYLAVSGGHNDYSLLYLISPQTRRLSCRLFHVSISHFDIVWHFHITFICRLIL